jgi:hypothetical protein
MMGFSSGVMFEKLQLVIKIVESNDHGKYLIRTLERIQQERTGRPNR